MKKFKEGQTVIVFNCIEWNKTGDLPEGNEKYFQRAKILKIRYNKEWLVDVIFEESLLISKGHFLRCIKPIRE